MQVLRVSHQPVTDPVRLHGTHCSQHTRKQRGQIDRVPPEQGGLIQRRFQGAHLPTSGL